MFELDWYIKKILEEERPSFDTYANRNTEYMMYGSNTMAVAPSRSDDEYTRIINYRHYLREIEHENISYSPVNIYRILKQSKNKFDINNK